MQTVTNQIKQSMAGSSWIRKMFEKGLELKKRYGADAVCDFSLGNPDVPPPAKTKEILEGLAAKAIEPLGLGYCPNAGIPAVREAIAAYLSQQQQAEVKPGNVVMTVGAAGALVAFFRAVIEPGDEVICPAPYFVEYASYCGHFGGILKPAVWNMRVQLCIRDFKDFLDLSSGQKSFVWKFYDFQHVIFHLIPRDLRKSL